MSSPLKRLIQATQEIIDGQVPKPIEVTSEDEIGQLTERFNEMARVLAEQAHQQSEQLRQKEREVIRATQVRNEFLSDVSHELRTPLTAIRSFCDLLLMFGDDDPKDREEFLRSIIESCDRLTRLINDILDSSKIEAGKIEWNMTPIDFIEIIHSSVRVMKAMAEEKGLDLTTQVPIPSLVLEGDHDRLIQVVTNLINNAVKFTKTGNITVSVEQMPQGVKVGVSDTGVGLAPEHQEMIFERFTQVKNRDRGKPTGTGLGLAICREIVEHHGGKIWVESQLGQGSTFYFTLPLCPTKNAMVNPEKGGSNGGGKSMAK